MRLLYWQWRAEMWKMLARKRTYLGFGAFVLLELILYLTITQSQGGVGLFKNIIQHGGESFQSYFSAMTVAVFVISLSMFFLGSIYLTLVGGDVVAKESEDGNLRLILARPISRLRLLALKFVCCIFYSILLVQFVCWTTLLLGTMIRGWGGGLCVMTPEMHLPAFFDPDVGLQRFALASVLLSFTMTTATSVAFFLSCLRIKPAAATISALTYLLGDFIVKQGNFVTENKHLLLTTHMSSWHLVYSDTIPWVTIIRHFAVLAGVSLTLFVLGALVFESRDVKS